MPLENRWENFLADKLDGLIFSEFLVDNATGTGFDTDGDGTDNKSDEFIEIQNTTGSTISLDGYELWSDDRGLLYSFGPADTVDPGQTATVVGEYTGATPAGYYDAGQGEGSNWLEDGQGTQNDTIYLVNTTTGEYIVFSYGDPAQPPSPPTGFPGTSQSGAGESIDSGAPNGVAFNRDANGNWVEGSPDPGAPGVVCFTAGTLISMPEGERPVETLQVGDLVTTYDSGPQPIQWIATRTLAPALLDKRPELRPIALEPKWTGASKRLLLSPQHAVLVRSNAFVEECLVRALHLSRMKGGAVRVASGVRKITYIHFMLPCHEVVFANGVATESFYPGAWAIETVAPHSQLSLLAQFSGYDLQEISDAYGDPKFPYAKSRDLGYRLSTVYPVTVDNPSYSVVDIPPPRTSCR